MKIFIMALASLFALPAYAALEIGKAAPDFTATDATGETRSLKQYEGDIVVLEWTNHKCPFVRKFYEGGQMQAFQKKAAEKGVTWLRVISSAPNKQGYMEPQDAITHAMAEGVNAAATLLDPSGELGRKYEAKTTPHMYVINEQGILIYQGAIDSNASADPADIPDATNYVMQAIKAAQQGRMPEVTESKPYGCSVKY